MVKLIRTLVFAAVVMTGFTARAQSPSSLDHTLEVLQKQAADHPFEKVYLHTDKPYYGAGDTIWFRGYVVVGADHYLSALSSVLNVELIDEKNVIKKSIKLPVVSGSTYGDIVLGDTVKEGSYRLRAYTTWMRNAGQEYFFDKTIPIINVVDSHIVTKSSYSYSVNNGQQTVNAIINYADINCTPYAGKEVKYVIQLDPKKIASSKGVTDQKGDLHITFVNPSPGTLTSGEINTTIQTVEQKAVTKTIVIKATSSKVDMQFFPESGSLINGITSKVAFKAVGADGLGAGVKGIVTDDQGNQVADLTATHAGMGEFFMMPEAGKNYKATITYIDGSTSDIPLPKALDKGYIMAINQTRTNIRMTVVGDSTQNGGTVLVAQSGGKVYLQGKSKPGQKVFIANIEKSKLPTGIIQFTLFSDGGEPLNERLIFVQNPTQLKLAVGSARTSYSPGQKVKVNLNVKDATEQPVQGTFSVSVTDETQVPIDEVKETTILSNLLLIADLKGYIEQPNYYFTNVSDQTATDLDILMLTQGYHRFEWRQIIDNKMPGIVYQPEKMLSIAGTVKTPGGKPVEGAKVSLIGNNRSFMISDTMTDKNGRFNFGFSYEDSTKFIVRASNKRNNSVDIDFDQPPPVLKTTKYAADIQESIDNGLETYLQSSKSRYDEEVKSGWSSRSKTLKEVNIKSRAKTPRELEVENAVQFSSNFNGPGNANQVITAEDIARVGCSTSLSCLSGLALGVTFSSTGAPTSTRGGVMTVILDGLKLDRRTVATDLSSIINIDDIASIEILRDIGYAAVYNASSGVIIITTKRGGQNFSPTVKTKPGFIQPKGFYKIRQFYSPQYDNPKTNTKLADLRTTIYWQPILQTDKTGNASFEYFNAGKKGTYRVIIEGIDYSGNLGRQVYRYKVE